MGTVSGWVLKGQGTEEESEEGRKRDPFLGESPVWRSLDDRTRVHRMKRAHRPTRGRTGEKRKTKKKPQDLFKSRGKRPLTVTASTFPGTGRLKQGGHPGETLPYVARPGRVRCHTLSPKEIISGARCSGAHL